MRTPAPVQRSLRLQAGQHQPLLVNEPAWVVWFQTLWDWYQEVGRYTDPRYERFGKEAPATPLTGMLAYSDGVNWDPVSAGAPRYVRYDGAAWAALP